MSNVSPSLTPPENRWPGGWLRYFPFESRSWRKIVAESNLSTEAKATVEMVVSRSKLMRFEKLEVVHELIAHFVDGKMAGRSYPQLVADFGDPDVTAKLIRRSKIRNRPIMFKVLAIFGWGLLALASIYAVFATYFHMGKPQPTVDYLADFNNEIKQTDDTDLAWPIYRPLWKKHSFSEGGGFSIDDLFVREKEDGVMQYKGLKKPTDAGWEDAVGRLDEISDLLAGFREARFKPRFGVPLHADRSLYTREDFEVLFPGQDYDNPAPLFNEEEAPPEVAEIMEHSALHVLLPHIQVMRTAARIFTVDTRLAIEQNDPHRVVTNLETFLGLARHASDSNTLVGSLVGFAIGGMGFELIEEVLIDHPEFLADEHLAQIQNALEKEDIASWMKIGGERAFLLDTIQRVYTDDGNGDGRITSTGIRVMTQMTNMIDANMSAFPENPKAVEFAMYVAEPASLFVVASRKETTELTHQFMEQFKAQIERPYWEESIGDIDVEEFLQANKHRHVVLGYLLPAFEQVHHAMVRTIARQEGVIAAVACQRYFLANGEWPSSFDQVSPDFVTEFPVDQMNGQFLNIKNEEDGVLVYSVGHDLDDDGGVMYVEDFRTRSRYAPHNWVGGKSNAGDFDADWILWPQRNWESRLPAETKQE